MSEQCQNCSGFKANNHQRELHEIEKFLVQQRKMRQRLEKHRKLSPIEYEYNHRSCIYSPRSIMEKKTEQLS